MSEPNKDLEQVSQAPEAEQPQPSEDLSFDLQSETLDSSPGSLLDLLRYHDRLFIQRAFASIAQREPSPAEFATTLVALRNGDRSKLDILEALVSAQKESGGKVVVNGLPSPTLRKLGRWPVIGPVFRVLRGITRLPQMMQDQQRFESYAMAQQQRIADFLNERVVPALHNQPKSRITDLEAIVADVVDSVMMLSDSVVELAAKQTDLTEALTKSETHLKLFAEQSGQLATQLTALETAQRDLQSQAEQRSRESQQLEEQLTSLVKHRETSESSFRDDLVRLTRAVQTLQGHFEALVKQLSSVEKQAAENTVSQREFLIQEQRNIVETQKVALSELQTQIADAEERTHAALSSLTEIVQQRGAIDPPEKQT